MKEPSQACWICRAVADSAEHRIKKADLIRVYGRGPYRGSLAPVHVRKGLLTPIQAPSASAVKYQPSLCRRCNTATTQPYDRAYDRLISWVLTNESTVLRKRLIDFGEVYGSSFEKDQRDLFKYCVKSFGCRLMDAGNPVPGDLVDLLPRKDFMTKLVVTFSVNEDILLLPEWRSGFMGKGDLIGFAPRAEPSVVDSYQWSEHVSWFTICYWYGLPPQGGLGSAWIANAQHVYLGSLSPLSPEQQAELRARIAED